MRINRIMAVLSVSALSLGMANAAVIEDIKASAEGAKKFSGNLKLTDVDGKKVFVSTMKGYRAYALKKVKVDPAKKYAVKVDVKQLNDKPSYIWIGFIPYTAKGQTIGLQHGFSFSKGSLTALAAPAAKGAKTIKVENASKWKAGKHFYAAFNAKKDMSDVPNFDLSSMIAKIDGNTITLTQPLKKAYPEGTMVRQHRSGGTYIYTKSGKAPAKWTNWKGSPAQGAILRKADFIRPMIMIRCNAKEEGAVFNNFIFEEL